jgi:hypothetical protein
MQNRLTSIAYFSKTLINQHIIQARSMDTLTDERHPEGLIAPLLEKDWETALTVILHSPHYAKRVNPMRGLPLHVAFRRGAPIEVLIALLEAYPDATTIRNYRKNLPCHSACCHGISSEGMKILLRCNPDAAVAMNHGHGQTPIQCLNVCDWKYFAAVAMNRGHGQTPIQCLNTCEWDFFADEKGQVMNDLKQHPSYWKSEEQQALLHCAFEETDRRRSMRRSMARIILGRQLDNCDLVALTIEYL